MPKPGDYIIVHFVDRQSVGSYFARKRLAWPLHITMAPWFSLEGQTAMIGDIETLARTMPPYDVTIGDEAQFGTDGKTIVNVVADQKQLQRLHLQLVAIVRQAGGVFESEQWVGPQHRAHVTHHGERRLHQGDTERIDAVHLVRVDGADTCEVVHEFRFGSSDETAA